MDARFFAGESSPATLYVNLCEFKINEGDTLERGKVIGLSGGGTGRATGPISM